MYHFPKLKFIKIHNLNWKLSCKYFIFRLIRSLFHFLVQVFFSNLFHCCSSWAHRKMYVKIAVTPIQQNCLDGIYFCCCRNGQTFFCVPSVRKEHATAFYSGRDSSSWRVISKKANPCHRIEQGVKMLLLYLRSLNAAQNGFIS